MLSKHNIISDTYESYRDDTACHRTRIVLIGIVSIFIAVYAGNLSVSALPAMALAVSVLAGFTFTALFSTSSLSNSDLPKPRDESDTYDLLRLNTIIKNLQIRSRLFLAASVSCLVLILLLVIPVEEKIIFEHIQSIEMSCNLVFDAILDVRYIGRIIVRFSTFFLFFELLYLFYRLSESIFSVLETRRDYLDRRG